MEDNSNGRVSRNTHQRRYQSHRSIVYEATIWHASAPLSIRHQISSRDNNKCFGKALESVGTVLSHISFFFFVLSYCYVKFYSLRVYIIRIILLRIDFSSWREIILFLRYRIQLYAFYGFIPTPGYLIHIFDANSLLFALSQHSKHHVRGLIVNFAQTYHLDTTTIKYHPPV